LLSYGDRAGYEGPCAVKSSDFRDARSELIVLCDDITGTRCDERCYVVATDFGYGGFDVTAVASTIDTAAGIAVAGGVQRSL